MRRTLAVAVIALGLMVAAGCSSGDDASAPTTTTTTPVPPADVTVTGPTSGGKYGVPYNPTPPDVLEVAGYVENEYFISGSADSFTTAQPLASDGAWNLQPGPEADYKTRIIVRRPEDAADFNGKVLVEWLNVSAGRDSDPDWGFLHPYLTREGWAYIGVSAQAVGVEGGPTRLEVPGVPPEALLPLKPWDPERYSTLEHPGDAWSYGIYSDVARLLRAPGDIDPLDGLRPETIVAAGESQSAGRMGTYVNGVQPIDHVYDGFLIHSRGRTGASLGEDPSQAAPTPMTIRTDLDVPVLQYETETDLLRLGFLAARQPDSAQVRTWEVAGTAHADQSTLDYGAASGSVWNTGPASNPAATCGTINNGPQQEVLRAALAALLTWIDDGTPPPTSPLIQATADDIATTADGNAIGGIRTPAVDAPVSALSGKGNPSSAFCSLFGQRRDYTPQELAALYPDHSTYLAAVTTSADAGQSAGFLLQPESDAFIERAEGAQIP